MLGEQQPQHLVCSPQQRICHEHVGLGTWRVHGAENMSRSVDSALHYGYRLFDNALVYSNEAELGSALYQLLPKHGLSRSEIFITSKLLPQKGDNLKRIPQLFEATLQHLQTDYVDLLLVHAPVVVNVSKDDPHLPGYIRDTWTAFEALQAAGKARSIGVSNYEITDLEAMRAYAKVWPPAVNQVEFHPRLPQRQLRDYCRQKKVFFQAYSSIDPDYATPGKRKLVEEPVVKGLAEKYGVQPASILLSYALTQGVGVIPKSLSDEHIRENYQCVLRLTDGDIADLDTIKDGGSEN